MIAKFVFEAIGDVFKPINIDFIKNKIEELGLPEEISVDIQISNIKHLKDSIIQNNLSILDKKQPKKKYSFLKRKSRGSDHRFNLSGIIPFFNYTIYTIGGNTSDVIIWLFRKEFVKNLDELEDFLFYNLNNKMLKYES